jgi:hypothetical protein
MSPLIDAVAEYRAALLRFERAQALRLVREYGRIYRNLAVDLKRFEAELADMPEDAVRQRRWKEAQIERAKQLRRQIEGEVNVFGEGADAEIRDNGHKAAALGLRHSKGMAAAGGISAGYNALNADAIETMLGFLAETSPLHVALKARLGLEVGAKAEQLLIDAVALGMHPKRVAALMRRELGQGLTWAMTTSRTAILWAYRTAQTAADTANAEQIEGWYWSATHDGRVCMGCIAMDDGTLHPPQEPLNDHHNGRCTRVTVPKGWKGDYKSGTQWFKEQDPLVQREMMGPAKYAAWKGGAIQLGDLAGRYYDPVYGEMVAEASLKRLVGEEAAEAFLRGE